MHLKRMILLTVLAVVALSSALPVKREALKNELGALEHGNMFGGYLDQHKWNIKIDEDTLPGVDASDFDLEKVEESDNDKDLNNRMFDTDELQKYIDDLPKPGSPDIDSEKETVDEGDEGQDIRKNIVPLKNEFGEPAVQGNVVFSDQPERNIRIHDSHEDTLSVVDSSDSVGLDKYPEENVEESDNGEDFNSGMFDADVQKYTDNWDHQETVNEGNGGWNFNSWDMPIQKSSKSDHWYSWFYSSSSAPSSSAINTKYYCLLILSVLFSFFISKLTITY